MRNVLRVAVREYRENVQTKAFWLGIFILPALLGASIALPLLFEKTKGARLYSVQDFRSHLLRPGFCQGTRRGVYPQTRMDTGALRRVHWQKTRSMIREQAHRSTKAKVLRDRRSL